MTAAALSMRTRSATGVAQDESYAAPFEGWGLPPRLACLNLSATGDIIKRSDTATRNFESLSTDVNGAL